MRLYSIQHRDAYIHLLTNNVLYATDYYIEDHHFRKKYKWMMEQMSHRIADSPFLWCYPIWAWYQFFDVNNKLPNLEDEAHLPSGRPGVMLELEYPDNEVLLSDFTMWNDVLNDFYIPESMEEYERYEEKLRLGLLSDSEISNIKRNSWNKIFDIDWCDEKREITVPRDHKQIQATVWCIRKKHVVNVTEFIAK